MADIESVLIGGLLGFAGAGLTQVLTHVFSVRRERHKLLREKAEAICEQVECLIKWVTERKIKALEGAADPETIPPIGKIVALQALYFKEAAPEVANLGNKALAVIQALGAAYRDIARADGVIEKALKNREEVVEAIARRNTIWSEHANSFQALGNEFVIASSMLTEKLVALVAIETKPRLRVIR